MTNGVKSWSYSALSLYEQCPAKYKYAKIDKLDEPKSEAMARGIRVHNEAEKFLTGQIEELPESLESFRDLFFEVRELDPIVEQEWAFNKDWSIGRWRDWKNCWLRCKLDFGIVYSDGTADVRDIKTGKPSHWNEDAYNDQQQLFALATFIQYPKVKNVTTSLWFVDVGEETEPRTINRSIMEKAKYDWEQRIKPLFNDTTFAPSPSKLCDWCHFRKSNGGPCKHG